MNLDLWAWVERAFRWLRSWCLFLVLRLKELEGENARLKELVAKQALDTAIPREAARGDS